MIIEVETTGPVTRVYLAGVDEDDVQTVAQDAVRTEEVGDVIYHSEGDYYEVIFNN